MNYLRPNVLISQHKIVEILSIRSALFHLAQKSVTKMAISVTKYVFGFCFLVIASAEVSHNLDSELLRALLERVDTLEKNDILHRQRIEHLLQTDISQKQEIAALRKADVSQRQDIAALRKTVSDLREKIDNTSTKTDNIPNDVSAEKDVGRNLTAKTRK